MTCNSNNDKWRSFSAIVFPPLRYNSPTITWYRRTSAVVSVTSSNRHISLTIYQKTTRPCGRYNQTIQFFPTEWRDQISDYCNLKKQVFKTNTEAKKAKRVRTKLHNNSRPEKITWIFMKYYFKRSVRKQTERDISL